RQRDGRPDAVGGGAQQPGGPAGEPDGHAAHPVRRAAPPAPPLLPLPPEGPRCVRLPAAARRGRAQSADARAHGPVAVGNDAPGHRPVQLFDARVVARAGLARGCCGCLGRGSHGVVQPWPPGTAAAPVLPVVGPQRPAEHHHQV
ncbi:hypothetical protein IWQ56_006877, partial [Coemansia nantahalensis]